MRQISFTYKGRSIKDLDWIQEGVNPAKKTLTINAPAIGGSYFVWVDAVMTYDLETMTHYGSAIAPLIVE